jgi:hypothetical protein
MNREDQNYLVDYQAGARAKKNGMKEIPKVQPKGSPKVTRTPWWKPGSLATSTPSRGCWA